MTRTRTIAGVLAIAFALPYLVLKVLWTAGVGIGVSDPELMRQPEMVSANAFTGLLELTSVGLALALIRPWGMRIPAWLLLFPLWVGTGLLAPFVAIVPIAYTADLIDGNAVSSSGELAAWVPAMVYSGFALQAIALLVAFTLYARERWDRVLRGRTSDVASGPTHALQRLLVIVVAVLAAIGIAYQAATLPGGTFVSALQNALSITLSVIAVCGLLMLVRFWRPAGRFFVAVALTWLGTAGMFAFGVFDLLINVLTVAAGDAPEPLGAREIVVLLDMLGAIVGGMVAAFLLTERDWEARVS